MDIDARRRLPRIVAAALVMGGLLWLTAALVLPPTTDVHGIAQALFLAMLISGGIAIYGLLLTSFGVVKWGEAINGLRD